MTIVYYKIAVKNVKKSFKDYSIYFLTLTLAVYIFYSFNSIESQKAMLDLNRSKSDNFRMMLQIISYMSTFVSIILGCLIVYANNFLIKKRKKELGIYMTFGMGKNKISRILTLETLIVSFISLLSGLLLGLFISQGLSIFTSKLFDVSMTEFQFTILFAAMGKTILYFGIIFILVMILNSFIISKYKIIDLLNSAKKSEDIKIKNTFLYVIIFLVEVFILGYAYKEIIESGMRLNSTFSMCIVLGIVGTILVFFSLSGFVLSLIKRFKNYYFKGLNIFVIKQLNSKVNTNFLSMSVICLMLFLTIVMLSTGLSFKEAMKKSLVDNTPFDATAAMYVAEYDNTNIKDTLNNLNVEFNNNEKYVYFTEYTNKETIQQGFEKYIDKSDKDDLSKNGIFRISYIILSEYNKIRELQNKEELSLNDNEVVVTSNLDSVVKTINKILKNDNKIDLGNETYIIKNNKVYEDAYYLNINYDSNYKVKSEEKFANLFQSFYDGEVKLDDNTGFIVGYTKNQIYEGNKGLSTTMVFIGIYLGVIFLISSMAVLSLQQLSEASDSLDRYKSLKRIGADEKMINKTIFTQTLIYFSLPLILALVHSVVDIKVLNTFISMFGKPDIGMSSLLTAIIFIVVYMGYLFTTYVVYKNIVKNS